MRLKMDKLEQLREVKIITILGGKDNGRRLKVKCPIHNEKTASLVLYQDNSYHCFGCGINGQNAIDFMVDAGCTIGQAIEELKNFI